MRKKSNQTALPSRIINPFLLSSIISRYITYNYTERGYYDNFEGSKTYDYKDHAEGMVHKQQYHLCGSDNNECIQSAVYVFNPRLSLLIMILAFAKLDNASFRRGKSRSSPGRTPRCGLLRL